MSYCSGPADVGPFWLDAPNRERAATAHTNTNNLSTTNRRTPREGAGKAPQQPNRKDPVGSRDEPVPTAARDPAGYLGRRVVTMGSYRRQRSGEIPENLNKCI